MSQPVEKKNKNKKKDEVENNATPQDIADKARAYLQWDDKPPPNCDQRYQFIKNEANHEAKDNAEGGWMARLRAALGQLVHGTPRAASSAPPSAAPPSTPPSLTVSNPSAPSSVPYPSSDTPPPRLEPSSPIPEAKRCRRNPIEVTCKAQNWPQDLDALQVIVGMESDRDAYLMPMWVNRDIKKYYFEKVYGGEQANEMFNKWIDRFNHLYRVSTNTWHDFPALSLAVVTVGTRRNRCGNIKNVSVEVEQKMLPIQSENMVPPTELATERCEDTLKKHQSAIKNSRYNRPDMLVPEYLAMLAMYLLPLDDEYIATEHILVQTPSELINHWTLHYHKRQQVPWHTPIIVNSILPYIRAQHSCQGALKVYEKLSLIMNAYRLQSIPPLPVLYRIEDKEQLTRHINGPHETRSEQNSKGRDYRPETATLQGQPFHFMNPSTAFVPTCLYVANGMNPYLNMRYRDEIVNEIMQQMKNIRQFRREAFNVETWLWAFKLGTGTRSEACTKFAEKEVEIGDEDAEDSEQDIDEEVEPDTDEEEEEAQGAADEDDDMMVTNLRGDEHGDPRAAKRQKIDEEEKETPLKDRLLEALNETKLLNTAISRKTEIVVQPWEPKLAKREYRAYIQWDHEHERIRFMKILSSSAMPNMRFQPHRENAATNSQNIEYYNTTHRSNIATEIKEYVLQPPLVDKLRHFLEQFNFLRIDLFRGVNGRLYINEVNPGGDVGLYAANAVSFTDTEELPLEKRLRDPLSHMRANVQCVQDALIAALEYRKKMERQARSYPPDMRKRAAAIGNNFQLVYSYPLQKSLYYEENNKHKNTATLLSRGVLVIPGELQRIAPEDLKELRKLVRAYQRDIHHHAPICNHALNVKNPKDQEKLAKLPLFEADGETLTALGRIVYDFRKKALPVLERIYQHLHSIIRHQILHDKKAFKANPQRYQHMDSIIVRIKCDCGKDKDCPNTLWHTDGYQYVYAGNDANAHGSTIPNEFGPHELYITCWVRLSLNADAMPLALLPIANMQQDFTAADTDNCSYIPSELNHLVSDPDLEVLHVQDTSKLEVGDMVLFLMDVAHGSVVPPGKINGATIEGQEDLETATERFSVDIRFSFPMGTVPATTYAPLPQKLPRV